jgi:hypothetical protein
MTDLSTQLPAIIAEAAKSPLGIFALMIISLAILGFFFFKEASERTRIAIFVMLFVGVAVFGLSIVRTTAGADAAPPVGGGATAESAGDEQTSADRSADDPSIQAILGSWTAEVAYYPPKRFTESFEFEIFGGELLTTATLFGSPRSVLDSQVENGVVRFEIAWQEVGGNETTDVRYVYTGQLNGDRLDFVIRDDRGESPVRFQATRAASP